MPIGILDEIIVSGNVILSFGKKKEAYFVANFRFAGNVGVNFAHYDMPLITQYYDRLVGHRCSVCLD